MKALRCIVTWIGRHRTLSLLVVLVAVTGAVAWSLMRRRSQGQLSPPLVKGDAIRSVYGIGTVIANRSYALKPGVTSTLQELFVKEGDAVAAHQKLAVIDDVLYRAPFAGTVTTLPYKQGENVFAQLPVLTLVDLTDRYLVVTLEQQGALIVRVGQKVKVSFDMMREHTYDGVVAAVYSQEQSFLARVDVPHLPPQVLPGMTADVAIEIAEHKNVLLLPVAALGADDTVLVKRGHGLLTKTHVKIGIVDKAVAEVVAGGVAAGDQVLVKTGAP